MSAAAPLVPRRSAQNLSTAPTALGVKARLLQLRRGPSVVCPLPFSGLPLVILSLAPCTPDTLVPASGPSPFLSLCLGHSYPPCRCPMSGSFPHLFRDLLKHHLATTDRTAYLHSLSHLPRVLYYYYFFLRAEFVSKAPL